MVNTLKLKQFRGNSEVNLRFVYPYGSTLTCQRPAVPVLSSGYISYPLNRPITAFCTTKKGTHAGKLVVIGSAHIFEDNWIDEEENSKLQEVVFKWLVEDGFSLDSIDADSPDLTDYHFLPNMEQLSDRLR